MKKILAIVLILPGLTLIISALYEKKDATREIADEEYTHHALSLEKDLDVATFEEHIKKEEFTIIDVRTTEEIAEGKIIDSALEINFYDDDFTEQLAALDPDENYLIYCRSGNRSNQAANLMSQLGFTSAQHLKGGINAWQRDTEN